MDLYILLRLIVFFLELFHSIDCRGPKWLSYIIHRHQRSLNSGILSDSPRKYKKCCQNGGLCILGSFCHCKKQFYGRYCQYTHNLRACGPVKHGAWVKSNCDLCRCFDGRVMCIQKAYSICDVKKQDSDLHPLDPSNNIYIFQDEPENELSDDDYFNESAASRNLPMMLAVVIACILGFV